MSQNVDLGPTFNFMSKNGKLFTIFLRIHFLDNYHKIKSGA